MAIILLLALSKKDFKAPSVNPHAFPANILLINDSQGYGQIKNNKSQ